VFVDNRYVRPALEHENVTGDVVVVACGAANSAKLLLASASDRHPRGLANGSDQVGRNYMFHNSQAVLALSVEPNPTVFQKTLGINTYYFATKDIDFPLGNIQMVGKSSAEMYRGEKPIPTKLAPERRRGRRRRRGSVLPSIGAVNPALTAMANAVRVGDHLVERLGTSPRTAERAHAA
jgi:choline dehydrogenase-like flavoprotein